VSAEVAVAVADDDGPSPAGASEAWTARFGRAAAEQILEGVGDRVSSRRGRSAARAEEAGGGAGFKAVLAGRSLEAYGAFASGPSGGAGAGGPPGGAAFPAAGGSPRSAGPPGAFPPGSGAYGGRPSGGPLRAALANSSFSAGWRTRGGSEWGLWGRGSVAAFEGRSGDVPVDGGVETGQAGADFSAGRWLLGLSASYSRGDGGYDGAGGRGSMESSMAALTPYAAVDAGRFSAWGALSAGRGGMTLAPERGAAVETDIEMEMGAAGLRGELADLGDGLSLSLAADAMAMRSTSGAEAGMPESEAKASRVRAAVEASWSRPLEGGGRFSAWLEGGARHDGGDAEEGFGAEVSAGLSWMRDGLALELEGRRLVAHEDGGFSQTGASAHLAWDCGAGGPGPSASLRRRWGAAAAGGLDRLLAARRAGPFGAEPGAGGLDAELGWGLALPGGRFLGTPFVLHGSQGGARLQTLGWLMEPLESSGGIMDASMALKLVCRAGPAGGSDRGILLEARLGF